MKDPAMIPADVKEWLGIANWLVTVLLSAVFFAFKYDKSNTKRIDDLESLIVEKIAEHSARLAVIDEKLNHVPSRSETAALTAQLDSLQGVISTLQKSVERQNDFLMNNK